MSIFKVVIHMPTGWYELYKDGRVAWNEYFVGSRWCDENEARIVMTLYCYCTAMFVTL